MMSASKPSSTGVVPLVRAFWASDSEGEMDPTTASECSDEVSISVLLAWDDDAILALVGLGSFDLGSASLLIIYWKL
jgi:hypothetical protein